MAARASYLVGFAGTATVLAGEAFGIPLYGTMAHSFIEAFDDEMAAFAAFAQSRPDNLVFLLDTYDTEAAARKVVALAPRLKAQGITLRGVRLDSGDLVALSRSVRAILDAGGLRDVTIFASGGLDEDSLAALLRANAPIDGFGVGTSLTTSADAPTLDCVYKLQEYAGLPRRKRSANKATWPGPQAGVAPLRRRRPHDRRLARCRRRREGRRALDPPGHAKRQTPAAAAVARRHPAPRPSASWSDCRTPLRALDPAMTYPVEVADELKNAGGRV